MCNSNTYQNLICKLILWSSTLAGIQFPSNSLCIIRVYEEEHRYEFTEFINLDTALKR